MTIKKFIISKLCWFMPLKKHRVAFRHKMLEEKQTKEMYYKSYSQLGEDTLIRAFMRDKYHNQNYKGFYVDIGAHHPLKYSNTALFYEKGWRGINIDAMPGSMKPFKKERSEDLNLKVAISDTEGEMDYFMFSDPAVNTLSKEFAENVRNNPIFKDMKFLGTKKVPVKKLSTILDEHIKEGQKIDFMNIDAEGVDYQILLSNNWQKYSPDYILIEMHDESDIDKIKDTEVGQLLSKQGYKHVGQTVITALFEKVK